MLKRLFLLIKPLLYKTRYNKRFSVNFNQRRWEKILIIIGRNSRLTIGKKCNFRKFCQFRVLDNGNVNIGDNVFMNTNVSVTCRSSISIGANSKIANNVVIIDHDHDYRNNNVGYKSAEVTIGDSVWIGANAVILKGVTIGEHSVVAAGSVVNKDIPAFCVAAGVPAKVIKENKNEKF